MLRFLNTKKKRKKNFVPLVPIPSNNGCIELQTYIDGTPASNIQTCWNITVLTEVSSIIADLNATIETTLTTTII